MYFQIMFAGIAFITSIFFTCVSCFITLNIYTTYIVLFNFILNILTINRNLDLNVIFKLILPLNIFERLIWQFMRRSMFHCRGELLCYVFIRFVWSWISRFFFDIFNLQYFCSWWKKVLIGVVMNAAGHDSLVDTWVYWWTNYIFRFGHTLALLHSGFVINNTIAFRVLFIKHGELVHVFKCKLFRVKKSFVIKIKLINIYNN